MRVLNFNSKLYLAFFLLILFSSCFSSDHWEIKEIKFFNGNKVYFKSHSWAIPERNSIILSNHKEEKYDSLNDIDFGSFVNIIYEKKHDSLFIYKSQGDEKYYPELKSKKYYKTKIKFVNTTLYLKLMDSLRNFPKDDVNLEK